MIEYSKEDFKIWLRRNTTLAEGTIFVYSTIVKEFYKKYTKLSFSNIAEFISIKNRETNVLTPRPAFLHYFRYLGLDDDKYLKKIPKVRKMPKKKQGIFLTAVQMKKLILNIDDELQRDIAIIQYNIGARAVEVITLQKRKLNKIKVNNSEAIQLTLITKGKKERKTILRFDLAKKILSKYLTGEGGFIFLPKELWEVYQFNEELFWKKLQSQRKKYYRALRKAAWQAGLPKIGTHDIRRFFINRALDLYKNDIFLVKNMVGHSRIDTTVEYSRDRTNEAKEATLKYQETKL